MASSVELGPGSRLTAPTRSTKSSRVSHFLRCTNSCSIIAICGAAPPNPVKPSRKNACAISRSRDPFFKFLAFASFIAQGLCLRTHLTRASLREENRRFSRGTVLLEHWGATHADSNRFGSCFFAGTLAPEFTRLSNKAGAHNRAVWG